MGSAETVVTVTVSASDSAACRTWVDMVLASDGAPEWANSANSVSNGQTPSDIESTSAQSSGSNSSGGGGGDGFPFMMVGIIAGGVVGACLLCICVAVVLAIIVVVIVLVAKAVGGGGGGGSYAPSVSGNSDNVLFSAGF